MERVVIEGGTGGIGRAPAGFRASADAPSVTGQVVGVDGGRARLRTKG